MAGGPGGSRQDPGLSLPWPVFQPWLGAETGPAARGGQNQRRRAVFAQA